MNVKRKLLIFTGFILASTIVVVILVIIPTAKQIEQTKKIIYDERVDLEKKYLRSQLLRQVIKDFENVKPQKEKLESIFVGAGKELDFVTALEKIAVDNELIQTIQLGNNIDHGTYQSTPLTLHVQGKYFGILKYIEDLEKNHYNFNLSSFSLNSNLDDNSVSADLRGEFFSLKVIQ
ncbi:MAG: hypothetical protein WCX71_02410 [Candidatus Buchananbacteria bacterium]